MKNNLKKITLIIILSIFILLPAFSDDFTFNVSEIEIKENGNKYKGINGGTVLSGNLKIISDTFEYDKINNIIEAYGNVEIIDDEKDILIDANKVFYYKNEEKIFTVGKTKVFVKKKYTVDSSDMILFRDKMILSSLKPTSVEDVETKNLYNFKEFKYLINEELLKGTKVQIIDNTVEFGSDEYLFNDGFFNLKTKQFSGKDTNIKFNKMMYDNEENDPRLVASSSNGDEFNTYLNKASYTTCKKTDKCPPWLITSKNVQHDKIKKQIIYKKAWLKIYDVPVVYFPKFFHPDPTVNRQSGFLKPLSSSDNVLGQSINTPYFYVISDSSDITFKPRFFLDGKLTLHNEFRNITKNSYTIADFSLTKGNDSQEKDKTNSRSHFFGKTTYNLRFENFITSRLDFKIEKASNDTYLKLFQLESPLLGAFNKKTLETSLTLDLEHEDYDFTTSIEQYESLSGTNNDRYGYVFPKYDFSKNIDLLDYSGSFSFTSDGSNNLDGTNQMTTSINNSLSYTTFDFISETGFKNVFGATINNNNSVAKSGNLSHKSSPQAEVITNYVMDTSFPLIRIKGDTSSTLVPKMSLRFSPHEMKNFRTKKKRIDIDNIWNGGRTGAGVEEGGSLTLGIDYKIDFLDLQKKNVRDIKVNNITKIKTLEEEAAEERKFEFKIAAVLRNEIEENIPENSTLGKKLSNTVGKIAYAHSQNFNIDYNFSVDNDFNTFEYNEINTLLKINNFETQISFIEENGVLGDSNVIENTSKYYFDSQNTLSIGTRRNRKINLTEYYDLTYRYQNDCLVAGLQYKKNYYSDRDIKPTEQLYFSITIVPLTKFQPDDIMKLFE